jgi:hypothetical protein
MRPLKLMVRSTVFAVFALLCLVATGWVRPALADTEGPTLAAAPSAIGLDLDSPNLPNLSALPSLVDEPGRTAPAAHGSEHGSGSSPWWVWAFVAAGLAGVVALVALSSSGKDPACPSDRVCR